MKTGVVRDNRYLDHDMGPFHVESPQRLTAIYDMLDKEFPLPLEAIPPRAATKEEITRIHTHAYFDRVKETAGRIRVRLDPDTSTSPLSFDTALLAAGGLLEACQVVMEGHVQNGFALVRPPGHHAEASQAMGFCLFNNVAIAAAHLRDVFGLNRVLIFDWDLHHGNGTQHSFYSRKDVLYFSTHQFPFYPGTGHWSEIGQGEGEGFTVNVPLYGGFGDPEFFYISKNLLSPIAEQYNPDFILVSAGFDIAGSDPLGGMNVSSLGFGALAHGLITLAQKCCRGRILFVLEGGYDLQALRDGVRQVLLELGGQSSVLPVEATCQAACEKELLPIFDIQRKYWHI